MRVSVLSTLIFLAATGFGLAGDFHILSATALRASLLAVYDVANATTGSKMDLAFDTLVCKGNREPLDVNAWGGSRA